MNLKNKHDTVFGVTMLALTAVYAGLILYTFVWLSVN